MGTKRFFALAAAALVAVVAAAGPAAAHPKPTAHGPADGSTVSEPPSEAWVEFDEAISQGSIEVYDPCGTRVDQGNPRVLANRVSVGVAADTAGTYRGVWKVVGSDSHPVSGRWTFTSSGGKSCPGEGGGGGGGGNGGGGTDKTGGGSGGGGSGGGGGSAADDPGDGGAAAAQDDGGNDSTGAVGGAGNGGGRAKDEAGGGKGRKSGGHGNHKKKEADRPDRGGGGAAPRREPDQQSISDTLADIPVDWLLIGFAISALIGAAGGTIYNSIVPRRR